MLLTVIKVLYIQYFFGCKTEFFVLPKQSQNSRSILQDGSRSLALFWKGKTCIIAKFLRTDIVICSHSREGKTVPYSRINMVCLNFKGENFDLLLFFILEKNMASIANTLELSWHTALVTLVC